MFKDTSKLARGSHYKEIHTFDRILIFVLGTRSGSKARVLA